eukprot:s131_g45.t1
MQSIYGKQRKSHLPGLLPQPILPLFVELSAENVAASVADPGDVFQRPSRAVTNGHDRTSRNDQIVEQRRFVAAHIMSALSMCLRVLFIQVTMLLASGHELMDDACESEVPYHRLFTVAAVGFIAGGALTIQTPVASAALYDKLWQLRLSNALQQADALRRELNKQELVLDQVQGGLDVAQAERASLIQELETITQQLGDQETEKLCLEMEETEQHLKEVLKGLEVLEAERASLTIEAEQSEATELEEVLKDVELAEAESASTTTEPEHGGKEQAETDHQEATEAAKAEAESEQHTQAEVLKDVELAEAESASTTTEPENGGKEQAETDHRKVTEVAKTEEAHTCQAESPQELPAEALKEVEEAENASTTTELENDGKERVETDHQEVERLAPEMAKPSPPEEATRAAKSYAETSAPEKATSTFKVRQGSPGIPFRCIDIPLDQAASGLSAMEAAEAALVAAAAARQAVGRTWRAIRTIGHAFAQKRIATGCTMQQRLACRSAYLQDTAAWHEFQQRTIRALTSFANTVPPSDPDIISKLHDTVWPLFRQSFPAQRFHSTNQLYSNTHAVVQNKWHIRQMLKSLSGLTLQNFFHAWSLWTSFHKHARLQRTQAKLDRQQRFRDLCAEAKHAADRHDSFGLFQIINKYSPKKPLKRIRLQRPDGHIADRWQAHAMIVQHVQTKWAGPREVHPRDTAFIPEPITIDDLTRALANLPLLKAVAPPSVPGMVWRSLASVVAPILHNWISHWFRIDSIHVPAEWRDAWIALLPKPGKPNTDPSHLRPISLTEPLGKCVMDVVGARLKTQVFPIMQPFPQFAYTPNRSTMDAIVRVVCHCRQIRSMTGLYRRTIHNQMHQMHPTGFYGGFQLFLDLQGAFDCVDRSSLITHLSEMSVDADICAILATWHTDTHYILGTGPEATKVRVGLGVRQGCKLAPTLWLTFLHQLFINLIPRTGYTWIQRHLTIFADDIHASCQFRTAEEFALGLTNVGHLLDVLEMLRLRIQYDKSHFLLAAHGPQAKRALRPYRAANGKAIQFQRPKGEKATFHLSKSAKYLGVIISYGRFETLTLQHRTRAAMTASARLRPWLRSRQMNAQHRLHLLYTCVVPVLTYGLHAVTLTTTGLRDFQCTMFKLIRTVLCDHSFRTHHTHAHILSQYHLDHPLLTLHRIGRRMWTRLTERLPQLQPDDIIHVVDWSHLNDFQLMITAQHESNSQANMPPADARTSEVLPTLFCRWCNFQTTSIPNLRRHCTNIHNAPVFRIHEACFTQFAYKGTPQCSHCFVTFPNWRQFRLHLERHVCQVPDPTGALTSQSGSPAGSPQALPIDQFHVMHSQHFGSELADLLHYQNWDALKRHEDARTFLIHNCPACGLWNGRTQAVHTHLKQHRPFNLKGVWEKAAQLSHLNCSSSPCGFCGKEFKRSHSCTVMTHAAFIWMNALDASERAQALLQCSVCNQVCDSFQSLNQHLKDQHIIQLCSYNAARDCLPGSTACAHCGAVFETAEGVRQHINDARCAHYDASASPETRNMDRNWDFLLASGDFRILKHDARRKMSCTLHCQFCFAKYTRQLDLSAHLAQAHTELWMTSHGTLRLLLDTVYGPLGCMCNPSASDRSLTHTCPALRQAAMAFHRSQVPLLIPTQFTPALIAEKLQFVPAHPALTLIQQALINRDFTTLWTQPDIATLLRTHCLMCGGVYHPAELALHIQRDHVLEAQRSHIFMQQLVDALRDDCQHDWNCPACGLTFNSAPTQTDQSEDRLLQQDIHLRSSCPTTQQCCYLFLDSHGLSSGGRAGHRDDGGLPTSCPSATTLPAGQESKRRRTATEKHQSQAGTACGRRRQRDNADDSSAHGFSASATRQGSMSAAQTGFFHLFHANQRQRNLARHDAGGLGVEEISDGSEAGHPIGAPPSAPDQLCGEVPPSESQGGLREPTGSGTVGHGDSTTNPDGMRQLANHDVVSSGTQVDSIEEEANPNGQTSQGAGPPDGTGCRAGEHHEIPQPTTSGTDSSLESTAERPSGHSLVPAPGPDTMQLLEPHRRISQDQLSDPHQECAKPSEPHGQGEGQELSGQRSGQNPLQMTTSERWELRAKISRLVMKNDGQNVCYANSAFVAALWAFVSRSNFNMGNWGARAALFTELLDTHQQNPLSLSIQPWFIALLLQWEGEGDGQADSAEFTCLLLEWISPACLDFRWEKRVQQGPRVLRHDKGSQFFPITIQIEPALCNDGAIPLSALLRSWHEEMGMCQALIGESDLLCVQIDRLTRNGRDEIVKDCTPIGLHCGQSVPIFAGSGINSDWKPFHVVAAVAHFGDTDQGHYQTLLSIANPRNVAMEPYLWLHADDNRAPRPIWAEPRAFLESVTLVWLCAEQVIEIHEYDDHMSYPIPSASPAPTDMLELLDASVQQLRGDEALEISPRRHGTHFPSLFRKRSPDWCQ